MLKILIVDDEPLVRVGIRSTLSSLDLDYEIIAEVGNGMKAIEVLENNEIDIVLTDIKMPKMNGIELIKWVNKNQPDVKMIVLSCYQDFEYVKEAFTYGAKDYILKYDIENDVLNNVINKIIIEKKNALSSSHISKGKNLKILKNNFLKDLFIGFKEQNRTEIISRFDELNLSISNENQSTVACMKIDNIKELDNRYNKNNNKIETDIINALGEYINVNFSYEFCIEDKATYYLIIQRDNETIEEQKIKEISKHVQYLLNKYLNISVSIGISKSAKDYTFLPKLYSQSKEAVEKRFFKGPKSIIFYKQILRSESDSELINSLKTKIHESIIKEQFGSTIKLLDKLKKEWLNSQEDISGTKLVYVSIFENIKIYYHKELKKVFIEKINLNESIMEKSFLDDIHNTLVSLIEKIANEKIGIIKNLNCSATVKEIISYINTHYNEYNLNLNTISFKVGYTPSYLSRLFKNETGMNIIDYINEVKIYKAKQMLKDPNVKVYQVAEMVGYKNYNYFSRIFKKICGVSPSEF